MAIQRVVCALSSLQGSAAGASRLPWAVAARAYRDPPGPESTVHANEGERQAKPDEELYGRPDRDPVPSPNPSLTQEEMSKAGLTSKPEPVKQGDAYPLQNDPSVAGTGAAPQEGARLEQDESAGPKAAGQDQINAGEFTPEKEGGGAKGGQARGVWSQ